MGKNRHWPYFLLALGFGFYVRIAHPWNPGLSGPVVFLESDPWYYYRLIENLLANFPRRLWFDPFTYYPFGTYTHYGPFLVYLGACLAKLAGATDPESLARILVFVPVAGGILLAVPVCFLAREAYGERAGVIAACLVLVVPGQLLGRSSLGFNDHHIWEVLWATSFFALTAASLARPGKKGSILSAAAGLALGLYMLTWAPGFTAALVVLLFSFLAYLLKNVARVPTGGLARTVIVAFSVAALIYLPFAFKYPGISLLHYSPLQLVLLLACIGAVLLLSLFDVLDERGFFGAIGLRGWYALPVVQVACGLGAFWLLRYLSPVFDFTLAGLVSAVGSKGGPETIGEVRPLFESAEGGLSLLPAWQQFSITFFFALAGMVYTLVSFSRERRSQSLLLLVWGGSMLLAVTAQNRFSYYFGALSAVFAAGTMDLILRTLGFDGRPGRDGRPGQAEPGKAGHGKAAVGLLLLALLFAPTLTEAYRQTRTGLVESINRQWYAVLSWMRENTPGGFVHENLYDSPSEAPRVWGEPYAYPAGTYGVMSWWDAGNWIAALARRIPHANPFQQGIGSRREEAGASASTDSFAEGSASPFRQGVGGRQGMLGAAPFFTAWQEREADAIAESLGTRFVVSDVQMATVKFHAMATWAEGTLERSADLYASGSGFVSFTRISGERTGISFSRTPPPPHPNLIRTLEVPNENYYRTIVARLHIFDGWGLSHYRMIYESEPESAKGFTKETIYRMAYNALYSAYMEMPEVETSPTGYVKVFEKVAGARVTGRAGDAGFVSLECTIRTNGGREFAYGQKVKTKNGTYALILPYAQATVYPVKPVSPYMIRAGNVTKELSLADEDLEGRVVTLHLDALTPGGFRSSGGRGP